MLSANKNAEIFVCMLLRNEQYRLNGSLFRSIGAIISIPGFIDIVRVTPDLYAGVCNGIFIIFNLLSLFLVQQLGCYMGFSITACVIAGVMFICYCIAVDEFATIIRCYNNRLYYNTYSSNYYGYYYTTPYYYSCSYRLSSSSASTAAGVGACLLISSVVETVVALTASIYCCNAVCCGATTTPSVSNKFMQ